LGLCPGNNLPVVVLNSPTVTTKGWLLLGVSANVFLKILNDICEGDCNSITIMYTNTNRKDNNRIGLNLFISYKNCCSILMILS
jgi:hypothetical protein